MFKCLLVHYLWNVILHFIHKMHILPKCPTSMLYYFNLYYFICTILIHSPRIPTMFWRDTFCSFGFGQSTGIKLCRTGALNTPLNSLSLPLEAGWAIHPLYESDSHGFGRKWMWHIENLCLFIICSLQIQLCAYLRWLLRSFMGTRGDQNPLKSHPTWTF